MYRVLIADDEAIVRLMLSNMIDWESLGLKLAGCVPNGRDAIAWMEEEPVDILITDIQMPIADGLEVIQYTKRVKNPPVILVLSAYHDFIYVRQAFKMGIYDYCLKRELNEELLTRHLEHMIRILKETGRGGGLAEEVIRISSNADHQDNRKEKLELLLRNVIEPEEAELPERYVVVCFSLLGYQRIIRHFGRDLEQEFYPSLFRLSNQIPQIAAHGVLAQWNLANFILVYDAGTQEQPYDKLLPLLKRLLKVWKNYLNAEAVAAAGSVVSGPGGFEQGLQEASINLTMKYVMKSRNLFSPMDYAVFSPEKACGYEEEFKELLMALKLDHELQLDGEKSRVLSILQTKSTQEARSYVLYLSYQIAAQLVHPMEDTDYVYPSDVWERVSALETNYDIGIWAVQFLGDMRRYVQSHYRFHFPDEIQKALDYLKTNYFKTDLTLFEVASEAGFSEKYFSSLFGKAVGMSFSSYLKELRMQHAKRLLASTGMKLKEICDAVGYNSVEYFVRVFSASTGMSPSAYRKDHTIVQ